MLGVGLGEAYRLRGKLIGLGGEVGVVCVCFLLRNSLILYRNS